MNKGSIKFGGKVIDVIKFNITSPLIFEQQDLQYNIPILYLSQNQTPVISNLIQENIKWICCLFKERGFDFIFIPQILDTLVNDYRSFKEILNYEYPFYDDEKVIEIFKLLKTHTEKKPNKLSYNYSTIINKMRNNGFSKNFGSGLLRVISNEEASFVDLDIISNSSELKKFIENYSNSLYKENLLTELFDFSENNNINHSNAHFSPEIIDANYADDNFDVGIVAKELEDKIKLLKHRGYTNLIFEILDNVLDVDTNQHSQKKSFKSYKEVVISKIVIDENYKIFLTAYNNAEVKLTPLPKAIFLLFLNHPKGIIFKHLPSYKEELYNIYKKIQYRETSEEIEKSIQDATNPFNNSINEKCARIKRVFVSMFDDRIAKNYYITGERGKEKLIKKASSLDRDTSFTIDDKSALF